MNLSKENQVIGYKQRINVICDNVMKTRPAEQVVYRPYIKPDFAQRNLRKGIKIDLGKYYQNALSGDYAYVYVNIRSQYTTKVMLTAKGASAYIINNRENVFKEENKNKYADGYYSEVIEVSEGDNELILKCVCADNSFFLDYIIGHIFYPQFWTSDYLLWERDTVGYGEYRYEQGFSLSELIRSGDNKRFKECSIVYPADSSDDRIIDLGKIYNSSKGKYIIAYTICKNDGNINIKSDFEYEIYVNGKKQNTAKTGDEVYIVFENKKGCRFESLCNENLHLPFVTHNRKRGMHWLLLGTLDSTKDFSFGLTKVYTNAYGERSFWRFADSVSYLRPYLDTSFYGQWFYGLMVGQYGLLRASEFDKKYYDYFYGSMKILADYYQYMQYDAEKFGDAAFLKRSIKKDDLDSIGTIGMNLCELYNREDDEKSREAIRSLIIELGDCIDKNIPRMKDGTFYRINTMWADDTFMSCPFLVRLGNITGENKYYDEAVKQLILYTEKLFIREEGVFSHIFFPELGRANNVPWGRGNGWVYLAFAETIEHLPDNYNGKEKLCKIFKTAVEGLADKQDNTGLWHQVLTLKDTFSETSCTAIFSIAIAKGIKIGILDKQRYLPIVKNAVDGILKYKVDEDGNVFDICRGSECKDDAGYYARLETISNDDHGIGVVVAAICELVDLLSGG